MRGGKLYAIIADVCAFANTNGGTLYVGVTANPKKPVVGIDNHSQSISELDKEIANRLSPPLQCTIDVHDTNGKKVIRILVPKGDDPPYAVDDSKIYIRSEAETGMAVRDEIVGLVKSGMGGTGQTIEGLVEIQKDQESADLVKPPQPPDDTKISIEGAPKTGVEIVTVEERKGRQYYTVRDLRNGNVVQNVTQTSARKLWHYAITRYSKLPHNPKKDRDIKWQDTYGLIHTRKQGKSIRYDLIQQVGKNYRYYFGVTEDGIHGPWRELVGLEEE